MPFDGAKQAEIELLWQARERAASTKAAIRSRLAEGQNWRCCLCGCRMEGECEDADAPSLFRVIPPSMGGAMWDEDNLVVACRSCNERHAAEITPDRVQAVVVATANALRMAL